MHNSNLVISLLVLCCLIGLSSCQRNKSQPASIEVKSPKNKKFYGTGQYYFGALTPSRLNEGKFDLQLVNFDIDSLDRVRGYFYDLTYENDGSRGSFSGIVDREVDQLLCKRIVYINGERYKEALAYPIFKNAMSLEYTDQGEVTDTLKSIDRNTFDSFYKTYSRQQLVSTINSSDRSRLKKLKFLKENGFTTSEIEALRFMEVAVDLNNEPSDMEYLIYIMDPMLCGTGGCNLFVVDSKGNTISEISVSRPPIYMPLLSTEEQQLQNGNWNDLYVYSQGMRKLSFSSGTYTTNASNGEQVSESDLLGHPENFKLLMDYLE